MPESPYARRTACGVKRHECSAEESRNARSARSESPTRAIPHSSCPIDTGSKSSYRAGDQTAAKYRPWQRLVQAE
jgi:hypothetical protein